MTRPTPAEIERYGLSITERRIRARSKYHIQSEMLFAQEFIERFSEIKRGSRENPDFSDWPPPV